MNFKSHFQAFLLALMILFVSSCGKAVPSTSPNSSSPKATLALVNGLLIDGTGAQALPDAIILLAGEKILAIGQAPALQVPAGVQTYDLQGAAVLPGFINAHVHYGFDKSNLEA